MSACYKFRRGLDIPLKGSAHLMTAPLASSSLYTLKPGDFKNTIPKLLVREGDIVQAGSPVYCDKEHPEILFTAPVSGTIHAIVRGEKRKITGVQILADEEQMQELFPVADPEQITPERIRELLLQSGCWPLITRRPYGTPAHPGETPKAIYISCFDSAPLAPHYDFTFAESFESLLMGIRVLERLCPGKVHLGLRDTTSPHSVFRRLPGIMHTFSGPHPAGNPGVQLHHVCPVGKDQVVWTLTPMGLSIIGKLFLNGTYDTTRMVAVTGSALTRTGYISCHAGIQVSALTAFPLKEGIQARIISGNPLTGDNAGPDGFLGFHHQQVTCLPEGGKRELAGWARPLRLNKFSAARTYISYLAPLLGKTGRFNLDTNLNGGVRAFVLTRDYQKVLPMDIFVSHLIKAILAEDIDKMELLGIYEVLPEDLALCEFVCPSKIEIQDILQKGIDLMIKEMQ
ncbi:MAG: Na(+)-translocating NADH-quinone reductase subunit A [Bacteroidales bacterium]|jgi:Na+-transporting NADH:ubiquinone oxidoreductase subunit A|nr:Na(+)-translocating NADH-quinone reductase subunit A [Bacteroidales bacterium]NLH24637.1 Na(+)-translocating NADH-quinone reductase subunit A [Bacteroidales bacterium]HPJ82776.1 Na(+)-translocating NADH-quinone reductase subunit A [Bacteroidales bacterium]